MILYRVPHEKRHFNGRILDKNIYKFQLCYKFNFFVVKQATKIFLYILFLYIIKLTESPI